MNTQSDPGSRQEANNELQCNSASGNLDTFSGDVTFQCNSASGNVDKVQCNGASGTLGGLKPPKLDSGSHVTDVDKVQCNSASGTLGRLAPPKLDSGSHVTGATKEKHRVENKRKRIDKQVKQQEDIDYWATHQGDFRIPTPKMGASKYKGGMCPSGLALHHEAAELLLDYVMKGCPVRSGQQWTMAMMQEAIEKGPHASAMDPAAMEQLALEVEQKEKRGSVKLCSGMR